MKPKVRICPNCSAHVLADDNICPRCDFDLSRVPLLPVEKEKSKTLPGAGVPDEPFSSKTRDEAAPHVHAEAADYPAGEPEPALPEGVSGDAQDDDLTLSQRMEAMFTAHRDPGRRFNGPPRPVVPSSENRPTGDVPADEETPDDGSVVMRETQHVPQVTPRMPLESVAPPDDTPEGADPGDDDDDLSLSARMAVINPHSEVQPSRDEPPVDDDDEELTLTARLEVLSDLPGPEPEVVEALRESVAMLETEADDQPDDGIDYDIAEPAGAPDAAPDAEPDIEPDAAPASSIAEDDIPTAVDDDLAYMVIADSDYPADNDYSAEEYSSVDSEYPEDEYSPAEIDSAPDEVDDNTGVFADVETPPVADKTHPRFDEFPPEPPADAGFSEATTTRLASERVEMPADAPDEYVSSAHAIPVVFPDVTITSKAQTPRRTVPRRGKQQGYIIPPAPYTPPPSRPVPPPPARITPPPAASRHTYGVTPAAAYLQQRVQAYTAGGYRTIVQGPHEVMLARGKPMGLLVWLLSLLSIIGLVWYVLIMALSGFQADRVYLTLEADGRVYEDGPGAAHIRRGRSRGGRRWAFVGLMIFSVCLVLAVILGAVGWLALERFKPELREAYPEITLFEDDYSSDVANSDNVELVKNGAVAFSILAGIAAVGLWGGATLFVIGVVHAAAYRAKVPPLPGYA
ncbi:MAG: hypothetical protein JW966_10615 [Anaerolineae bacterium]|nr:hypothetical protein [Anaerolineae bacterium]